MIHDEKIEGMEIQRDSKLGYDFFFVELHFPI
jgi:hypothetical protein